MNITSTVPACDFKFLDKYDTINSLICKTSDLTVKWHHWVVLLLITFILLWFIKKLIFP